MRYLGLATPVPEDVGEHVSMGISGEPSAAGSSAQVQQAQVSRHPAQQPQQQQAAA
jgi:hypothetical protein